MQQFSRQILFLVTLIGADLEPGKSKQQTGWISPFATGPPQHENISHFYLLGQDKTLVKITTVSLKVNGHSTVKMILNTGVLTSMISTF